MPQIFIFSPSTGVEMVEWRGEDVECDMSNGLEPVKYREKYISEKLQSALLRCILSSPCYPL